MERLKSGAVRYILGHSSGVCVDSEGITEGVLVTLKHRIFNNVPTPVRHFLVSVMLHRPRGVPEYNVCERR